MLVIWLLTHNRSLQAIEAINSILAQDDRRFHLVVSDNSTTDELRHLINNCSDVTYLKRPKVLTAIEHTNLVLSEIQSEFFMLFHDDDLMLPNCVSSFWKAQELFPSAASFGGNAHLEKNHKYLGLSFQIAGTYYGPISSNILMSRYFSRHQLGIAPLPSYIYNKRVLQDLRFNPSGGKYSDVEWLSECAAKGPMIWISEPIMVYRLHDSNDSNIESLGDRLKFFAYLKFERHSLKTLNFIYYRRFLYKKYISSVSRNDVDCRLEKMKDFLIISQLRPSFVVANLTLLVKKISVKGWVALKKFIKY